MESVIIGGERRGERNNKSPSESSQLLVAAGGDETGGRNIEEERKWDTRSVFPHSLFKSQYFNLMFLCSSSQPCVCASSINGFSRDLYHPFAV